MSLESDRERSGSLGNVSQSQEWLRWLKCGPGRAGVAGSESRELSGVGSCLEQGKGRPGGWCEGP
jgi:hypothetical protein